VNIPQDKILHFAAGACAAALATVIYVMCVRGLGAPLGGVVYTPFIASLVAGITKEGADYMDNRAAGVPVHEVSYLDALATTLPGLLTSLVLYFNVK
jgi:hypothetical protein